MHIRIDVDACQGHNRCALTYPEIFDVDDDVKAFVHVDKIPPEWEEKALLAIANCPERAISIHE
jgi:ferredoxin